MNTEKHQLEEECSEYIKRRTKLELDIKDLEHSTSDDNAMKNQYQDELKALQVNIGHQQRELDGLLPAFNQYKSEEEFCTKRYM